jgi:hypothetical protein
MDLSEEDAHKNIDTGKFPDYQTPHDRYVAKSKGLDLEDAYASVGCTLRSTERNHEEVGIGLSIRPVNSLHRLSRSSRLFQSPILPYMHHIENGRHHTTSVTSPPHCMRPKGASVVVFIATSFLNLQAAFPVCRLSLFLKTSILETKTQSYDKISRSRTRKSVADRETYPIHAMNARTVLSCMHWHAKSLAAATTLKAPNLK